MHMPAQSPPPVLLLVNLGTPSAPTAQAVATYLDEFLMDPRVVQLPRWLWRPLLRRVILPRRSPVVAKKYAEIWLPGGSPLVAHTRELAQAVQQRLSEWRVEHAMRYGAPSLADTLRRLRADGMQRVRVLPLYPQYSTTTTASVLDAVQQHAPDLPLQTLQNYHVDPGWVAAVADSIRNHWHRHGRGEKLLLSFHGIPQRLVRQGDPYAAQCAASTAAIATALGLHHGDIVLTFQSRFGRERWLQPYTLPTLEAMARAGVQRVDVVCPGFAVDCLETLEEIRLQTAAAFRTAGGKTLAYIPCLNASAAHADALAALVRSDTGWQ
ncbi:MAG: ferrochelatase [Xanthomonadaceae bacterium]|nr:ferrochelatase [Xanthomonadaceae bacterium]